MKKKWKKKKKRGLQFEKNVFSLLLFYHWSYFGLELHFKDDL